jgi:hypothetical protein
MVPDAAILAESDSMRILLVVFAFLLPALAQTPKRLLVISIDGMDHRYLRDADRLGLRIPNLRRLIREGEWADGVLGVIPTVTWPSHTTMLTGVRPAVHGILDNHRPASEGGEYYWNASLIRVPTLWDAAKKANLKTAAITWPSTVDAPITWNLPEYFQRRRGGAMDLDTIGSKSTPGLVEKIVKKYPSFAQQWMDDRTRTLALLYLLTEEKPDFLAVHFVDLDSEAHETGPFSSASNAILEYTDELLGLVLKAMPRDMAIAVVSDHGFARVRRYVNVAKLEGKVEVVASLACARDDPGAQALREAAKNSAGGVGREVPADEWKGFAPEKPPCVAAFEPSEGVLFATADRQAPPREAGVHGLWPGRPDYRASYVLWHEGIKPRKLGEVKMLEHAGRFARILGIDLPKQSALQ